MSSPVSKPIPTPERPKTLEEFYQSMVAHIRALNQRLEQLERKAGTTGAKEA